MSSRSDPQAAPGELELVRLLLNTWQIPNATRMPVDQFEAFLSDQGVTEPEEATALRQLRDELREAVEGRLPVARCLQGWLERYPLQVVVEEAGGSPAVRYRPAPGSGLVGRVLAATVAAVANGTWVRLKACPDCRWVFYDRTRNGSKRWCGMYARGPEGRACGTIAKVRRYRERRRQGSARQAANGTGMAR